MAMGHMGACVSIHLPSFASLSPAGLGKHRHMPWFPKAQARTKLAEAGRSQVLKVQGP